MRQSTGPEAGGVFISYRRDEATAYAHLLHYLLNDRLGDIPVFLDLHAIDPGEDFGLAIQRAVTNCRVLLVLIGPHWVGLPGTDGRPRLQDPDDLVRIEVETALKDAEVLVIPVLVERAAMPRSADLPDSLAGLCRRQSLELGHASFQHDIRRLLEAVERRLRPGERSHIRIVDPGTDRGPVTRSGVAPGGDQEQVRHLTAGLTKQAERSVDPTTVAVARVGSVEPWSYNWPDTTDEYYPTTTRYTVTDGTGYLDVLVACGRRHAYGRDRGRVVVFGNSGGASSTYYPWTEFVETDDGEYAAKLYNPADHRKSLRDGDTLPSWLNPTQVRRNDAVFRSVRHGPALRLVVSPDDEHAMIRHGYWVATLRRAV